MIGTLIALLKKKYFSLSNNIQPTAILACPFFREKGHNAKFSAKFSTFSMPK